MKRQQIPNRSASRSVAREFTLFGAAIAFACLSASANAEDPNGVAGGRNKITVAGEKVRGGAVGNANTAVGNARVIMADGTSLSQGIAGGETRWFAFGAEAGKTYTVEVLDPYGDLGNNFIGSVGIFDSDGVSSAPETSSNCAQSTVAPSMEVSVDGIRCVIRMFVPDPFTTLNKRGIFIGVGSGGGTVFQIRVRESTLYGRWTTNGYDFHVELQNTTTDPICVQVVRYPDTGQNTLPTGTLAATTLTVPPMGANKTVFPNGSAVGGTLRGALRIHDCGGGTFVAGSLQLNTLGFSTSTGQFIIYSNTAVNSGNTANTW